MAMMGGGGLGLGLGGGGMGGGHRGTLASGEYDLDHPFDWRLLGRLGRYLRPYGGRAVLSTALMVIHALANLLNPYLIGLAIDRSIARGDRAGLGVLCLVLLAVNVGMWAAQYGQVWLMSWVGQTLLYQLSRDMFIHLQSLSLTFYDRTEVGRIMSRLQSDVAVLENTLTSGLLAILGSLISLVGIVAAMVAMNAPLALLSFTVLPVMTAIALYWQRFAQRSFRRTRASVSVVNATLQEHITGVRVVQSLAREAQSTREFAAVNRTNLDSNLAASRISALILPLVEVVAAVAIALVVVAGGTMVAQGHLQVGVLVAFTLYINRFFDPIRDLSQQYNQLQRTAVATERIFELLDLPVEIRDRPGAPELPPIQGEVRFEHVGFAYTPDMPVLSDLSLHLPAGQTLAIVGPTGAGKSTIANLLLRFYDVQDGRITVDGYDVRAIAQQSLRRQVGMVLQEPFLFSGTVRHNIRIGRPEATNAEVEAAARAVGAHTTIMALEKGYETRIRERGNNLSPGQRQLISFARALLADPRILILDEATANLDGLTEQRLQQGLRRLLAGRTALVIAHRLSTIRDADIIAVLLAGQMVERGTHAELLDLGGHYARLHSMGFQQL
jgi:ABC-type multidrug transport system fused ATPase/permease subunit